MRRHSLLLILLGCAVLGAVACDGDRLTRPRSRDPGWIAFTVVSESGVQDIYRIRPDGTALQQVTTDGVGGSPTWAPDRRRIAYTAYRPNGFSGTDLELRVHDLTTGTATRLTQWKSTVVDADPVWMRNRARITFTSNRRGSPNDELLSIAVDGTDLRPATEPPLTGAQPDFSPDGKRLAIVRADGIYVGPATGAGLSRITDQGFLDRYPEWSPDGRRLVFVRVGLGIQIVNSDGTGLHAVTLVGRSVAYDDHATWSPDGTRIAFVGLEGLFVVRADGTDYTLVLPGRVYDPSWSR